MLGAVTARPKPLPGRLQILAKQELEGSEPAACSVQGEQRAEPLHLTTAAVFVLPWPVSHGYTTGSALIHHSGFWCNQQLAKDLVEISSTPPKSLFDNSSSQAKDRQDGLHCMAFAEGTPVRWEWDSWLGVLQARGHGESTGIFRVGEWTFCKKPVSAMMSRGQRKLRLT